MPCTPAQPPQRTHHTPIIRKRLSSKLQDLPFGRKDGRYFLTREQEYVGGLRAAFGIWELMKQEGLSLHDGLILRKEMFWPGGLELHIGVRATARAMHAMCHHAVHTQMFIPTLQSQGTPEQQAYWLDLALNLKIIGTYAQTARYARCERCGCTHMTHPHRRNSGMAPMCVAWKPWQCMTQQARSLSSTHPRSRVPRCGTIIEICGEPIPASCVHIINVVHSLHPLSPLSTLITPIHPYPAQWWPGGLGKTATHVVLMARLFIGGRDYGPHSFVVQIRDLDTHRPLPGVTVGDIGAKMGYNGVDNGFLSFDHVRIRTFSTRDTDFCCGIGLC